MKLLLAVDQSKDSKVAINLLRKFQWPAGSSLLLLHVTTIDDEKRAASTKTSKYKKSGGMGKPIPDIHAELRRVEKLLASETLKVQSIIVKGIPGQEILAAIRRKKIDLVVLGSRGLSRVSGMFMGSVSGWVLKEASCSVLVGRPTTGKAQSLSTLKLLLAIDGSPDACKAAHFLKGLTLPAQSKVLLLHVIKKQLYETEQLVNRAGKSWTEFSKLAKDLCKDRGIVGVRILKDARDALSSFPFNIEERLAKGHEASAILKVARQQKADLVVVGSKGTTGLRRILMGSVSHHVSQHAPCSVLVLRSLKKS